MLSLSASNIKLLVFKLSISKISPFTPVMIILSLINRTQIDGFSANPPLKFISNSLSISKSCHVLINILPFSLISPTLVLA
jgi:hypothetical protein